MGARYVDASQLSAGGIVNSCDAMALGVVVVWLCDVTCDAGALVRVPLLL